MQENPDFTQNFGVKCNTCHFGIAVKYSYDYDKEYSSGSGLAVNITL